MVLTPGRFKIVVKYALRKIYRQSFSDAHFIGISYIHVIPPKPLDAHAPAPGPRHLLSVPVTPTRGDPAGWGPAVSVSLGPLPSTCGDPAGWGPAASVSLGPLPHSAQRHEGPIVRSHVRPLPSEAEPVPPRVRSPLSVPPSVDAWVAATLRLL